MPGLQIFIYNSLLCQHRLTDRALPFRSPFHLGIKDTLSEGINKGDPQIWEPLALFYVNKQDQVSPNTAVKRFHDSCLARLDAV